MRKRYNFTLDKRVYNRLRELSRVYDKPMSRVLEDLILEHGFEGKKVKVNESKMGSADEILIKCDEALSNIRRVLEDPRLRAQ